MCERPGRAVCIWSLLNILFLPDWPQDAQQNIPSRAAMTASCSSSPPLTPSGQETDALLGRHRATQKDGCLYLSGGMLQSSVHLSFVPQVTLHPLFFFAWRREPFLCCWCVCAARHNQCDHSFVWLLAVDFELLFRLTWFDSSLSSYKGPKRLRGRQSALRYLSSSPFSIIPLPPLSRSRPTVLETHQSTSHMNPLFTYSLEITWNIGFSPLIFPVKIQSILV